LGEIPVDDFFKAEKSRKSKYGGTLRTSTNSNYNRIDFNRDVWPILEELMDKYRAHKYDVLLKNCNHFSDELIRRLYAGQKGIPRWINRAAWFGSWFHCLVPTKYLTVTPEGCEEEAA